MCGCGRAPYRTIVVGVPQYKPSQMTRLVLPRTETTLRRPIFLFWKLDDKVWIDFFIWKLDDKVWIGLSMYCCHICNNKSTGGGGCLTSSPNQSHASHSNCHIAALRDDLKALAFLLRYNHTHAGLNHTAPTHQLTEPACRHRCINVMIM